MSERAKLVIILAVFGAIFFLPVWSDRFWDAVQESLSLARWYAREHVILCLVPAFFIAGAIGVFVSRASVMKYLGPKAPKALAYGVASVCGTILTVCSCTVLPLFASIHKRGAGLGPATAFLYSGPAINVLAIILTARVLGLEMGIARAVGALSFAVVIGLLMHLIFRKEEAARQELGGMAVVEDVRRRTLWQDAVYFASMLGILVFANWGKPHDSDSGFWHAIYAWKWFLSAGFAGLMVVVVSAWFQKKELTEWTQASWAFAKQILPLLLGGVLVAGFLLGGPGGSERGIIPNYLVAQSVGGNSLAANFLASVVGALMYFCTLMEIPILEGLISSGMGKGPALALLLAGPAVSLPNMLVIRSVLGTGKTAVFLCLVVALSTVVGMVYGSFF